MDIDLRLLNKSKTVSELKKAFKVVVSKHVERFYPVNVLKQEGFVRRQCKKCGTFFWTATNNDTCGDVLCRGGYSFIDKTPANAHLSYPDIWHTFSRMFAAKGYTPIKRYPVVARWRADTDFVQASIYDFQPYVISGEVEPPSEKLVIPQTSLRFNDIENVGLTGAHYTGFVMIGQHAFMPKAKWKQEDYFMDIYDWLVKGLRIKKDYITFHEDVWAGGGNFGPSIEFFSGGLELGNQVYMMFENKNNSIKELKLKVLDMGMGHERNAWFSSGDINSYESVFPKTLKKLRSMLGLTKEFGTNKSLLSLFYSKAGLLNIGEARLSFDQLTAQLGLSKELLKLIHRLRALYSIVDHVRALLWAISDGALPSNVGGGYNLRVILRRALSLINQYDFDIDLPSITELLVKESKPLFPELLDDYEHVKKILEIEKKKYVETITKNKRFVERFIKDFPDNKEIPGEKILELYTSKGITPESLKLFNPKLKFNTSEFFEALERFKNQSRLKARVIDAIPSFIIERLERLQPPKTEALYFDHYDYVDFKAEVLFVAKHQGREFVVLDRTAFYPRSGGQDYDKGFLNNIRVVSVLKHKTWIVHEMESQGLKVGDIVNGKIDFERRQQLTQHHTATHILNGACKRILGKHVWQAGAAKTVNKARLDITHYEALSKEEINKIQELANQIIKENRPIYKYFLKRNIAEERFGMTIYQGGAVPGKVLRIVEIQDFDVEACGGTHLDITGNCWKIKILKTSKIQDGVVRLEFVAGKAAKLFEDRKHKIADNIAKLLDVDVLMLPSRVEELFGVWKYSKKLLKKFDRMDKQELSSALEHLKLKKKQLWHGNWESALDQAAMIVRTNPETLLNTVKRFLKELEQTKNLLSKAIDKN